MNLNPISSHWLPASLPGALYATLKGKLAAPSSFPILYEVFHFLLDPFFSRGCVQNHFERQ